MQEKLKQLFLDLDLEGFSPYLENTTYLVLFFYFLLFCCLFNKLSGKIFL